MIVDRSRKENYMGFIRLSYTYSDLEFSEEYVVEIPSVWAYLFLVVGLVTIIACFLIAIVGIAY
jgi:hypothetical protein